MENNNNKKLNLFELEALRSELIYNTLKASSTNLRLFLYQNYFEEILLLNNSNIEEAFLKEFLDDYLHCLKKFEVWCNDPEVTKRLLEQLNKIKSRIFVTENLTELLIEKDRVELQQEQLTNILNGDGPRDEAKHKAFFPLIDKETPDDFYGRIDSITVRLAKAADADKFIIVPSEKEIEKRILEQCRNSWLLALNISKRYVKKPYKHHEIIISFDKREGFYEGNSLGIALTLAFLEEILKFYNPTYVIKLGESIAFTGGVNESGKVLNIGEEIIKQKVKLMCFSQIKYFVIPKIEETFADLELTKLQKEYPKRKLKIIPVEEINDVINRRDLIEIKKQKLIVRTGKFAKKNWVSAAATVMLAILLSFLFVMDFDDNPASLSSEGSLLYVKNKNGKTLWKKNIENHNYQNKNSKILRLYCQIVDINDDGNHEVLIANEVDTSVNVINSSSTLRCYDKSSNLIWQYKFTDVVISNREILEPYYSILLIDTLTLNHQKSFYLISCNSPSYASAIYRIDLKTGKRLPGTMWCSGHINDAILKDINNDSTMDILAVGLDNGYEQQVIYGFKLDTLTQVRLTTDDYLIKNYEIAQPIVYIRIPKSDYTKYKELRFVGVGQGSLLDNQAENVYRFIVAVDKNIENGQMWIRLNYNLKDINIIIDGQFRVMRDSLVSKGLLNNPFTDTKEYKDLIKKEILYWVKGNWLRRENLENYRLPENPLRQPTSKDLLF